MSDQDGNAERASAVEQLLDQLLTLLPGTAHEVRTALTEAEEHLIQDVQNGLNQGLSQREAEAAAVRRFGSADLIAAAERRWRRTPATVMLRQSALSALYLAAVGGLAVGASGALIAIMGWIAGATFIVDTSRLATALTSTDCVRFRKNDPHASSCYQAALNDWAHDTVVNRLALGLLALLALLVFIRLRRRWPRDATRLLPPLVVNSIGLTTFGAASLWLVGTSIDSLRLAATGAGQWLGSTPPALAAAAWFAIRLHRELRAPATTTATAPYRGARTAVGSD